MKIDKLYIEGIVDATLSDFEQRDNCINPDKDLEISYNTLTNSKDGKVDIGCQVTFTWITKLSHDVDDNVRDENYIKIYSKDKIAGVVSDVYDIFSDINKCKIEL
jgi:hypothetical protein